MSWWLDLLSSGASLAILVALWAALGFAVSWYFRWVGLVPTDHVGLLKPATWLPARLRRFIKPRVLTAGLPYWRLPLLWSFSVPRVEWIRQVGNDQKARMRQLPFLPIYAPHHMIECKDNHTHDGIGVDAVFSFQTRLILHSGGEGLETVGDVDLWATLEAYVARLFRKEVEKADYTVMFEEKKAELSQVWDRIQKRVQGQAAEKKWPIEISHLKLLEVRVDAVVHDARAAVRFRELRVVELNGFTRKILAELRARDADRPVPPGGWDAVHMKECLLWISLLFSPPTHSSPVPPQPPAPTSS